MRRLELRHGKPSKHGFWELDVDAHVYTIRAGDLRGRSKVEVEVRTCASAIEAAVEAKAKLEAKLRKGWIDVELPRAELEDRSTPSSMREPTLEAAIARDPIDRAAWTVYADWLLAHADPCGEAIALSLHATEPDPERDAKLEALTSTPTLTRLRGRHDVRASAKFEQHYGLVTSVTLAIGGPHAWHGPSPAELIAALTHAPAGRLLTELRVTASGDDHRTLVAELLATLGRGPALPCLRRVFVEPTEVCWDYERVRIGGLDSILRVAPNLERLHVAGGAIELHALAHPHLRELTLETSALPAETARAVANAELPECARLVVYFGGSELDGGCDLADLRPLWTGAGVAKLRELGLVNADFNASLMATLAGSALLARLDTLDLSLGTLRDSAADELVALADTFAHLRRLDLSGNFLSADACERLLGALPNVVVADQRDPYASTVSPYYVSVGE